jgi:DNA-binding response OmpR family regulator
VLDAGVSYLPKPFSPLGLSAKVREVLGSRKASGRLLVIDDDDGVRAWLHHVLTGAGYEVLTAANGKEGIRLVHEQHFDVVITDLVMPEQEGLETVRLLRHQYPEVRIIAISGAFAGNYLKSARLLGAHAAIFKPIDRDHLLASVHELMETVAPVA